MSYLKLQFKMLWLKVAIWVVVLSGLTIGIAVAMGVLYSTPLERMSLKTTLESPAMTTMVGPVPEGDFTEAVLFLMMMLLFLAMIYGLFNILMANQVFKHEENNGLTELLIASGEGRKSLFVKQIIIGILINIPFFAFTLGGLNLLDMGGATFEGHLLFVGGVTLFGLLFYALTLLVGSLFETGELTFGITLIILIGAYLYRGMTDVADMTYSVIAPYNWLTRASIYSENEFIWLMPFLIIPVILIIAYVVTMRRDVDDGVIKLSGKRKAKRVRSYPKLLVSQSKLLIIAWMVALVIIGLSYGAVLEDIENIMNNNFIVRAAVEAGQFANPTKFFVSMISIITAIISIIPGLMVIGKLLKEEKHRLEWMIAGGLRSRVTRVRVFVSHLVLAIVLSLVCHALYLVTLYAMTIPVPDFSIPAIDYVFALISEGSVLILILGIAAMLYGVSFKLFKLVWPILAVLFIISYVGIMLQFPEWLRSVSPFHHLGHIFVDGPQWLPISLFYVIGFVLMGIGIVAASKRDLVNG